MARFESKPMGLLSQSRYPIFTGSPAVKVSVSGEKVGVIVGVSVGAEVGVSVGMGVSVGTEVSVGMGVLLGGTGVSVGPAGLVAGDDSSTAVPAWSPGAEVQLDTSTVNINITIVGNIIRFIGCTSGE